MESYRHGSGDCRCGLTEEEVSNERTGIIMGSGGPSTRTIVDSADITREKGPKRVGPFAVPKAMSSTASATLATFFKIKGINYSISSACATSNHCIGNAYEMIQYGKQDRMFAGGCEDLDWTLSVLFDAMGAMSSKYNDTPSTASRAYDKNRDGFVIAGGAGVLVLEDLETALARTRCEDLRRNRGLWRNLRRLRHGCTVWRRRNPLHENGAFDRHVEDRLHQSARNIDACGRRPGNRSDPPDFRRGRRLPANRRHQIAHRPFAGRNGRAGSDLFALMMQNNFICESAHIEELDPAFADMPIVRKRIDNVQLNTVLSNSFGFGGTNATLVFQRYQG